MPQHDTKPSIDLEGGAARPISSRRPLPPVRPRLAQIDANTLNPPSGSNASSKQQPASLPSPALTPSFSGPRSPATQLPPGFQNNKGAFSVTVTTPLAPSQQHPQQQRTTSPSTPSISLLPTLPPSPPRSGALDLLDPKPADHQRRVSPTTTSPHISPLLKSDLQAAQDRRESYLPTPSSRLVGPATFSKDHQSTLGSGGLTHAGTTVEPAGAGGDDLFLGAREGRSEEKQKKRPSFILTPANMPVVDVESPGQPTPLLGLGFDFAIDDVGHSSAKTTTPTLVPSPRFRRQYPTSAPPSPALLNPDLEQFSTPLSSPTFPVPSSPSGSFLTPLLHSSSSSSSPTLPIARSPTLSSSLSLSASTSSSSLEVVPQQAPASPRMANLTEPIARLVRRASNSHLNGSELALPTTAVSRSPSPSRRSSFVGDSSERKEREKGQEVVAKKPASKKKEAHSRTFSNWMGVLGGPDHDGKKKSTLGVTRRRVLWGALAVVTVLWLTKSGGGTREAAASPRRIDRRSPRTRVPGAGRDFIHPQVLNRHAPRPPPSSAFGAPWRVVKNAVALVGGSATSLDSVGSYRPPPPDVTREEGQFSLLQDPPKKRLRNLFATSKPVEYQTTHALPPPPVHSDAPERDTLVLYRILGNDLPPRHSPGQTLRNLRFLLQHESDFSSLPHVGPHPVHHSHAYGSGSKSHLDAHQSSRGLRVDKYFVLNRIADPEMVHSIVDLLTRYSVPRSRILVIPFEWEEYETRDFRWDGGVDKLLGWGVGPQDEEMKKRHVPLGASLWDAASEPTVVGAKVQRRAAAEVVDQAMVGAKDDLGSLEEEVDPRVVARERRRKSEMLGRLRALDFTYHEKNLYAMNNNGGRNFALAHGRSLPHARWILPLDGNSFFTPFAMHSITRTLSIAGEGEKASRYVIIPMHRLLSNEAVLSNNTITLVPRHEPHDGTSSPADDATKFYSPKDAPETPEEPQIGFRYDSTETYQEAMRYGRRSKLELLWRLGAIPYARALDRRTLPWEQSDRDHVTADSWGSIPGVEGTDNTLPYHQPHGDVLYSPVANPPRGALAFAKAGWVYRLCSGNPLQEEHNQEAIALRSVNRIKGIVAFLERLDEHVARGFAGGCATDAALCGFRSHRLWSFDTDDVERMRQKFKAGIPDAVNRVEHFQTMVEGAHHAVSRALTTPYELSTTDANVAANNATMLAMAGFLTGNSSYSSLAADLITSRFVRQVPMFYRVVDQREQLKKYKSGQGPPPVDITQFDGPGYAFPAPPTEDNEDLSWSAAMVQHLSGAPLPKMPFEPLEFDPILLMDAVRLLSSPNSPKMPKSSFAQPEGRKAVNSIFTTQLSYLLFNPTATDFSANPPSAEAGAHFDAKVAALAAFIDDARLFIRVANRGRLRLSRETRQEGLLHPDREIQEVHFRLVQGVSRTRLIPYNLASDPMSQELYHSLASGRNSAFDILRL
ncbi:hypothetical protein T439DRAFT_375834 [Meredithblackwellia eburnea MCA 4105]